MTEYLACSPTGFRCALKEVKAEGLVERDMKVYVIFIHKPIQYNKSKSLHAVYQVGYIEMNSGMFIENRCVLSMNLSRSNRF